MDGVGVLLNHLPQGRVISQFVPLLDEVRQVSELAVLHDQVYVGIRLPAVDQGDYVRVVEALEDLDFAVEIILELAIQLGEVDRLDGYESSGCL